MIKYKHLAIDEEVYNLWVEAKDEYFTIYPEHRLLKPSTSYILKHILRKWIDA